MPKTIMTFVVSRADGDQSIHAQTIMTFVVSRAHSDQSMHAQTISRKLSDGGLKTPQNYFLPVRLNPTIFKRNFCTMHETLAGVGKTGCATNREW